jgi:peptidoglycan/LPS O-acetylase OafA/YrhL
MSSVDHPIDYRPDVDGLRAIAVLAVVGFHAGAGTFRGGFVGVDIFFVVSGFLISSIIFKGLDRGDFSFREFYVRRIRRIFPALVLVLAFSLIAGWYLLLIDDYRSLGKQVAAGAAFVPNFALWQETGYFDTDAARKPLLHLWSLGIEEQYYLVWPLLVFLLWKSGWRFLSIVGTILFASFFLNVATVRGQPEAAFYLPYTRFWELMVGSLLAYINMFKRSEFDALLMRTSAKIFHVSVPIAAINNAQAALGLVLMLAAIFALNRNLSFPGWWALLPTLGTFWTISAGPNAWINRQLLAHPVFVCIGLFSDPLYLWHWTLHSFHRIVEGYPSRLMILAAVAASFPLAWATYQFVEKPIRRGKSKQARKQVYAPALVVLMLCIGTLGFTAYEKRGVPDRFSAEIAAMLKQPYDMQKEYRYKRCFLEVSSQSGDEFGPECIDAADAPEKPLVFLWGDSHAAHLYPGLRNLQKGMPFRLAQYTGCAPFLEGTPERKGRCAEINSYIEKIIARTAPQIAVLGARWTREGADLRQRLERTVNFLRAQGVKEVILVGPTPIWKPDLKSAMAYYYFRYRQVSDRMMFGLEDFEEVKQLDAQLQRIAKNLMIEYLSPLRALCDDSGCLTRVDESPDGLVSADRDHFSAKGSIFFFNFAAPMLAHDLSLLTAR